MLSITHKNSLGQLLFHPCAFARPGLLTGVEHRWQTSEPSIVAGSGVAVFWL